MVLVLVFRGVVGANQRPFSCSDISTHKCPDNRSTPGSVIPSARGPCGPCPGEHRPPTEQPLFWPWALAGGCRRAGTSAITLATILPLEFCFQTTGFDRLSRPVSLGGRVPACSGPRPTAGLASPAVCRKAHVSRPSCRLSPPPPPSAGGPSITPAALLSASLPRAWFFSLGKNTEGCFLHVGLCSWVTGE